MAGSAGARLRYTGARRRYAPGRTRRDLGLALVLAVIAIAVQLRNPAFLTLSNLDSLLTNTAILAILAVGMMLVLVTRGIDLSVGSILAFSGMVTALAIARRPAIPPPAALAIGSAIGAALGTISGVLVGRCGVLPVIATLGMMNVVRGLTYVVSGGRWVSSYQMPEAFKAIATGRTLYLNNLVVIALVVYAIAFWFVNHTRTGRRIYAVGSNPEAATVSGLAPGRLIVLVYAIAGGLAGLGGVLWVARFASAQGNTAVGYELQVIAACILGGVSITGGVGRLSGVVLGTLILGLLANALPLIDVSPFWQMGIQGAVVLAAVIGNVLVRRTRDAAARRNRGI